MTTLRQLDMNIDEMADEDMRTEIDANRIYNWLDNNSRGYPRSVGELVKKTGLPIERVVGALKYLQSGDKISWQYCYSMVTVL